MTDPTALQVVARGNHAKGYYGVITVRFFTGSFSWECGHRHPKNSEARDCIRRYVWRLLDDNAPSGVARSEPKP